METLYELARLCSKHRRMLDALIPGDEKSPLNKLYKITYAEEDELSDAECMLSIYGKKRVSAFSRLKSRLRDVFYHVIILTSTSSISLDARSREFLENFRQTLIARSLVQRKSAKLSTDIIEKSIVKSMRYHVTENVLEQSRMLIAYYNGAMYNKYKLKKYQDIQSQYLEIYKWEIKSENYYLDLQRDQFQSLATPTQEMKNKAFRYYSDLKNADGIRSYFFNYNKYRIEAAYFEYVKDYQGLLKSSEAALKEFSSPDFRTGNAISTISVRKLWALIQVGMNKEAISEGKRLMKQLSNGSVQWYRIGHYTLKAQIYSGDYSGAIETITEMVENPKFQKLGDYFTEIFMAALGYIHLLVDSDIVDSTIIKNLELPEFKLAKFLNTTPVFSKDKRGINVSILLMHIGFLLQRKEYGVIIDKIDSLNQYAYRYLRKDDSFRSNCMIKMVVQMAKADFHPLRTERYTSDLREQLGNVALSGSGDNIEIEIVPFEVLWQIMKSTL